MIFQLFPSLITLMFLTTSAMGLHPLLADDLDVFNHQRHVPSPSCRVSPV
jgi:hypothetical protein